MGRADPYVSTLDGMERTVTGNRKPKSTTIETIIDMYGERPLPPIPRVPSSIYASSKQTTLLSDNSSASSKPQATGAPRSPATPSSAAPLQTKPLTEKDPMGAKHLSQLFKKEPRATAGKPDTPPLRQDATQRTGPLITTKEKVQTAKPVPFTEWKAPAYKEPSSSAESSPRMPLSQQSPSLDSPRPSVNTWRTAEGRAASYFALISPESQPSLDQTRLLSPPQTGALLSSLSIVKEKRKERSVPFPIQTNSLPEIPPESHFSPSSPSASDVESASGVASSLRSRAKKALLPSKAMKRPNMKQRMNSNQSDLSFASSVTSPSPSILATPHRRNSIRKGRSDSTDTLQSTLTQPREGAARPPLLRGDHSYPLMKALPIRDPRNHERTSSDYQHYIMKARELPTTHPYVHKVPRKRLSKYQIPAVPTMTTTMSPDTTYKIEMPPLRPSKRPDSTLLLGDPYDIEISSFEDPHRPHEAPEGRPPVANAPRSHNLSRSFSGSASNHRRSHRLSKADKRQTRRFSLPTGTHSRHNTADTTLSNVERRALDTDFTITTTGGTSAGREYIVSAPMQGFTPAVDSERGRYDKQGKWGRRGRTGLGGRSTSAGRRREALKKRIKIMGDPCAVGVPF